MAQTAEDIILKAMQKEAKPLRQGDIAELTGIKKNDVSKAIKNLSEKGKVVSPGRCVYESVK